MKIKDWKRSTDKFFFSMFSLIGVAACSLLAVVPIRLCEPVFSAFIIPWYYGLLLIVPCLIYMILAACMGCSYINLMASIFHVDERRWK